jgi:hypothetical protein
VLVVLGLQALMAARRKDVPDFAPAPCYRAATAAPSPSGW